DALSTAGWSADDVTVCGVTRPCTDRHGRAAADAIGGVFGQRLVPVDFSHALGVALAAAPPIELALLLKTSPGARVASGCVGPSGESAVLAFETFSRTATTGLAS